MIVARFEFLPEFADQFSWSAGQTVVEILFDDVFDLIQTCQEHEHAIADCTAIVEGHIINLVGVSA